jgi:hypothetical protein
LLKKAQLARFSHRWAEIRQNPRELATAPRSR